MKQLLFFLCLAIAFSTCQIQAQSTPATDTNAQIPVTSADSPEIATFQKLEDDWSISVSHRDQYGLELVLSPLFVGVSATGEISTRDQQVARMVNSEDKTLSLESRVVTVRMLGDVAVVNGTYVYHHHVNGNAVDERGVGRQVVDADVEQPVEAAAVAVDGGVRGAQSSTYPAERQGVRALGIEDR